MDFFPLFLLCLLHVSLTLLLPYPTPLQILLLPYPTPLQILLLPYPTPLQIVPWLPWVTYMNLLGNAIQIPYAIGETILGVFAYFIRDYVTLQWVMSALMFLQVMGHSSMASAH